MVIMLYPSLLVYFLLISSTFAAVNYTLTRDDLIDVCERTRMLIGSGVEPDKVEKIVLNNFLHKDAEYGDDTTYDTTYDATYNSTEEVEELEYAPASSMTATMEGYFNSLVQIITKFIVAENINIYISYADYIFLNILGKREATDMRRVKMPENDVCREVDFPSQLDMKNGKEVTQALLRLSMDAMDHINKFFKATIEKLTQASQ